MTFRRSLITGLTLATLLPAVGTAWAAAGTPISVLFVGNSYTIARGLSQLGQGGAAGAARCRAACMTTGLHNSFYGKAASNPGLAGVVPVGDAFQRAVDSGVARGTGRRRPAQRARRGLDQALVAGPHPRQPVGVLPERADAVRQPHRAGPAISGRR